jgi:hypothetical protein
MILETNELKYWFNLTIQVLCQWILDMFFFLSKFYSIFSNKISTNKGLESLTCSVINLFYSL